MWAITRSGGAPTILAEARETRGAINALADTQRAVAARSRRVVRDLHDAGLTGIDISAVLGVSDKRVSQLLN
jgi:DNA-directed RNA polymerase specialized sigma subunit